MVKTFLPKTSLIILALVFITSGLLSFLSLNTQALAQTCPGNYPELCRSSACPNGTTYDVCCKSCSAYTTECIDVPSCLAVVDCRTNTEACSWDGWGRTPKGYCCPRQPHCQKPGCGAVECNLTTGGCYSDCSSCFAWLQTKNGDVHGSDEISITIPDTCTPANSCNPYLSLAGNGGMPGVVSSTVTVNLGSFAAAKVSEREWKATHPSENIEQSVGFGINHIAYDYNYFRERFNISPSTPIFMGPKPLINGVYFGQGNLEIDTFGSDWRILRDESFVIFIDGTLTVKRKITVDPGGFLAFIVSGNITFDQILGNNPSLRSRDTSNIEGIFISNGIIETSRGDVGHERLVGRGIFVADADLGRTGGFSFHRNLGSNNDYYSAELLEYRPDLLINFPQELGIGRMSWLEVAP